jgi:hypothetical protein
VVRVKAGPKVAVLLTPFVLEGGGADCKSGRQLKTGQRLNMGDV